MAKLYFNSDIVDGTVIPSVDSAIGNLGNINMSLSIPAGFSQTGYLNDTIAFIGNTKAKLSDLKEWLQRSSNVYKNRIDTMTSTVNSLPRSTMTIKKPRVAITPINEINSETNQNK